MARNFILNNEDGLARMNIWMQVDVVRFVHDQLKHLMLSWLLRSKPVLYLAQLPCVIAGHYLKVVA